MADQEVIKHTKKIYKVWNSKEHGFWHKAKEFALEIIIIVFAVTLSIWLHGLSEHSHQQKDVKEFLLGLKTDLQNDLKEMKEDRRSFMSGKRIFNDISSAKAGEKLAIDSINTYSWSFFNTTGLLPNNGRFEGFKSSGKIGTIENRVLQNEILDLYQENIPILIQFTNRYTNDKEKFADFLNKNLKRQGATTNIQNLLNGDEARNLSQQLVRVDHIVTQYNQCINNINRIIKEIDDTYKE